MSLRHHFNRTGYLTRRLHWPQPSSEDFYFTFSSSAVFPSESPLATRYRRLCTAISISMVLRKGSELDLCSVVYVLHSLKLAFEMPLAPPPPTQSKLGELFRVTGKIPGWLNVSKRSIIYSLGKSTDGPVLEMGCLKGKSTTCFLLARKAAQVAALHVVAALFKDHVDSVSLPRT